MIDNNALWGTQNLSPFTMEGGFNPDQQLFSMQPNGSLNDLLQELITQLEKVISKLSGCSCEHSAGSNESEAASGPMSVNGGPVDLSLLSAPFGDGVSAVSFTLGGDS